jgi:tRNA (cmo5U34)-methyltransferase
MTSDQAHHEHDWLSDTYVREWIESDITRDAERRPKLRRAVALLGCDAGRELRILDVGGGYGEFTAQVLEELARCTVVLHDFSPAMIAVAQERLARFGGRVEYRLSDLGQRGWSAGLGGPFDAAVSALAIHNLRQPELIKDVYRELYTVLAPGAAFANFDYVFPSSPGLRAIYARALGSDGFRDEPGGGHVTLEDQLRWLREAGFAEVDCISKDLFEVLLVGLRGEH